DNPAELLPEEEEVMNKLLLSFQQSEKLRRHMSF
ncbi:fructose-bisphosphatase class III, partial [Staphylococcus aureus]